MSQEDADVPAYNVFTRRDGTIRHFWASEMYASSPDPGQDPRGAPDLDPLWTLLDTTPEGRGKDWYPDVDVAARLGLQAGKSAENLRRHCGDWIR